MNNTFALRTAIAEYADAMQVAGRVVDANEAASSLSAKYPCSQMTMTEIIQEIERASVAVGAALLSSTATVGQRVRNFPSSSYMAPEFDAYLSATTKDQFS
jgi:hypothetical protein